MEETTEPTREQIEAWASDIEHADWREDATIGQQEHVLRLAIRTLDAEAQLDHARRRIAAFTARDNAADETITVLTRQLAAMTERAETAERERDAMRRHYDAAAPDHNLLALLDLYHERAENAEQERGATSAALNDLASGLRDALDGLAMVGEKWTDAVKRLRKQLAEVERERDEARSRIVEQIKKSLPHAMENAKAVYKYDGNESRARAMAVLIVDEALQCLHFDDVQEDLRTKLATATPNASAPATDARIDCESSSLLLLSTWARKVMMRPKNRDKGVPSESVEELLAMARHELTEARDAIEENATTDDILAELGDAATCIAFVMRDVESQREH